MIDTSSFEYNVLISECNLKDGVPQKISFANHKGNVVKCYKYRTRKVKQEENTQHE